MTEWSTTERPQTDSDCDVCCDVCACLCVWPVKDTIHQYKVQTLITLVGETETVFLDHIHLILISK